MAQMMMVVQQRKINNANGTRRGELPNTASTRENITNSSERPKALTSIEETKNEIVPELSPLPTDLP